MIAAFSVAAVTVGNRIAARFPTDVAINEN
jgi:hypothetical protein